MTATFSVTKYSVDNQHPHVEHKVETPHVTLVKDNMYGTILGDGELGCYTKNFIVTPNGSVSSYEDNHQQGPVSELSEFYNYDFDWPTMDNAFSKMSEQVKIDLFGESYIDLGDVPDEKLEDFNVTYSYDHKGASADIYYKDNFVKDEKLLSYLSDLVKGSAEMYDEITLDVHISYRGYDEMDEMYGNYTKQGKKNTCIEEPEDCFLNSLGLEFKLKTDS